MLWKLKYILEPDKGLENMFREFLLAKGPHMAWYTQKEISVVFSSEHSYVHSFYIQQAAKNRFRQWRSQRAAT